MLKTTLRQFLPQSNGQNDQGWFDSLSLCQEGDTIRVVFPHTYFAAWFSRHKRALFEEALNRHFRGRALPRICYQESQPQEKKPSSRAAALDTLYDARPDTPEQEDCFASFLCNTKNAFPLTAAREMAARKPGSIYNPFVLCGRSGTGKSHLLEALQRSFSQTETPGRILKQKALRFCQEHALCFGRPEFFWQTYSVLLLDDLQELTGLDPVQQQLAALMDACPRGGDGPARQMVFAHSGPSRMLKKLDERLYSRLESGLVLELFEPDMDIRLRYLQSLCRERRLTLPKEQLLYLAQHCAHFRLLQGLILKLEAFVSMRGKKLSPADLENIVRTGGVEQLPGCRDILNQVAVSLKLRPEDILSGKRRPDMVLARQVAMYLCRQRLGLSYPELGRAFGGRDHSTVIHAIKKIKKLRETDKTVSQLLTELENKTF
ncbi:MAG: helix-turn-helix domain-containing protein [Desulfovibrionaceae bacterium]|nr:helix-turn-helix domain-containing protein [Desulfovibrionaceae bacterium]